MTDRAGKLGRRTFSNRFMLESTATLFALVLTRLSGLLVTGAFVFGHTAVPVKIRGLIALTLAMLVTPTQLGTFVPPPSTVFDLAWLMLGELAVGAALGIGLAALMGGLSLAGDIIDQQAGTSLGQVFDPASGDMTTQTGTLFITVMTVVLLAVEPFGVEEQMIRGLLDTFTAIPPGSAAFSPTVAELLVGLGEQGIVLGLKVAAPLIAVASLVSVTLGFLGASVPQVNVLVLGLAVRAAISLFVLVFCMGPTADLMIEMATSVLAEIISALLSGSPEPTR